MITKQKVYDRLESFNLSNQQKEQVYNLITEVGTGGGNENKLNIYVKEIDGQLTCIANDKLYGLLGKDVNAWEVNSIELYQHLINNEIKVINWNVETPTDIAGDNLIMISNSVEYVKCKDYIMCMFVLENAFNALYINNKDS